MWSFRIHIFRFVVRANPERSRFPVREEGQVSWLESPNGLSAGAILPFADRQCQYAFIGRKNAKPSRFRAAVRIMFFGFERTVTLANRRLEWLIHFKVRMKFSGSLGTRTLPLKFDSRRRLQLRPLV
jgi:hypothetical protein